MSATLSRTFRILMIILLLLLLGFYRDFLFKKVNALLKAWDFDMSYEMPEPWRFLENWDYDSVMNFKWLLTLVFTILFLLVSLLAIRLIFRNRRYMLITIATYAGVTVVCAALMLTGKIFPATAPKLYELSRYLMGMAQSPIILMILVPAFKLSAKEARNIKN